MPVMFLYAFICSSGKDNVGVGFMTVIRSDVLLKPYSSTVLLKILFAGPSVVTAFMAVPLGSET
jgi:hypothetical protein